MGSIGDTARGCGLAVIVLLAVLSIPGLYAVYKLGPCVTGEVTTTTAVTAEGKMLTATSPVCPEEGQTYVRAVGLALIVGVLIVGTALGVLAFNGVENIGLGMVAIWKGQTPINSTARDITPDSSREAEMHAADVRYRQTMTELAAMKAELGRLAIEDRKGWQALPAERGAAANGTSNGNGHKGGAGDLSGFEVLS